MQSVTGRYELVLPSFQGGSTYLEAEIPLGFTEKEHLGFKEWVGILKGGQKWKSEKLQAQNKQKTTWE